MRRIALIAAAALAAGALVAAGAAGESDTGDEYLIRAYFDNAGFLVKGEEVRIAGATVGSVQSVDVTRVGEIVTRDGEEDPGKAVAVLSITDPGFQDFRTDASCLIRPQSLLGEKFVECEPTQPRAPGTDPPPALDVIGEGELGEGQLFLPLENNGKAVDLDLVNNITRESEVDRFRLILNDLGAGLAARGEVLGDVIERANPALRETDEVLAILAEQNRGLARLTADSDTILAELAGERDSVVGFINNAATTGEAAAERRDDIARGFRDFPPALAELESTMVELRRFAEAGTPVATDLNTAAPSLAAATRELTPFSKAGTTALRSLGDAAQLSQADLVASDPVIRQLRKVGKESAPGNKALAKLLKSLRKTGGIDYLMAFILNSSNVFNGFDDYGHYLRASLEINNCVDYVIAPTTSCGANWGTGPSTSAARAAAAALSPETIPDPPFPKEELDAGGVEPDADSGESDTEQAGHRRSRPPRVSPTAFKDLLWFLTKDAP